VNLVHAAHMHAGSGSGRQAGIDTQQSPPALRLVLCNAFSQVLDKQRKFVV
jgi:hypothetical protein